MLKTHTCGALNLEHVGSIVTLAGWVNRRRDHGGLIFIDLRDRFGITQVTINSDQVAAHDVAAQARSEYVIQVRARWRRDRKGCATPTWARATSKCWPRQVTILNTAKTPPFYISWRRRRGG
jgi:aspartyl-tRNA synthetase